MPNIVKVNCDASRYGNGFTGIGFVLRNDLGEVMAVGVEYMDGNLSVNCAKAVAIRLSMVFSRDMGFSKFEVESDCKVVIDLRC